MPAGFFDLFRRGSVPPIPVSDAIPLTFITRIIVADVFGNALAELDGAEIEEVTWRLQNVGKLAFTIARTDAKATETNLTIGNRVFVEFDNGLPNWGGMIWLPREWGNDRISVTCYSMEQILQKRQTQKSIYYRDRSVGAIFRDVLLRTEQQYSMNLRIGNISAGPTLHTVDYHYQDILWIIQTSLTRNLSAMEFRFRPVYEFGKIYFYADLFEKLGVRKNFVALLTGHNVARTRFREQGPLHNWIDLAGGGTGWGEDRITAHTDSVDSISRHGLLQHAEVQSGVVNLDTLEDNARVLLEENKWPAPTWDISVIDLEPGEYQSYDIGDEVRFLAHNYGFAGFDGYVRILGRSYRGQSGECDLIVEQVVENE